MAGRGRWLFRRFRTGPQADSMGTSVMSFLSSALGLIVVMLGIARSRFHARLPAAAVAAIDFIVYWAMLVMTALGLTSIVPFTALELFDYRLPPEQGYRAVLGIMRLGRQHGNARLDAASDRAMAARYWRVSLIGRTALWMSC